MSFSDKFSQKAFELQAKAKVALGQALDDKDREAEGRADLDHIRATRDTAPENTRSSESGPVGRPARESEATRRPARPTGTNGAGQRPDATGLESRDTGAVQRLFSAQRASEYNSRWTEIKGDFVDEPRRAIAQADRLVGDVLDELHELFSTQRHSLDHGLDSEQTSTEDLRIALGRYRAFFDRLLSL